MSDQNQNSRFSKVTVYLKDENSPISVYNFEKLMVGNSSQKEYKKTEPDKLFISSTDAYMFVGNNNVLSINGAEIRVIKFE